MRISHEAIYEALFVQGRGGLRRELTACLRTGRALRVPQARTRGRGKKFVTPEILISERPPEAEDRAVPGHWEGDLIVGLASSAIGTLVERSTRFTMLVHLARMEGHGDGPRIKNGPALAGHGAAAVRDAIASLITTLPDQLRRSLTWDQGAEMAQHAQLRIDTGLAIYPALALAASPSTDLSTHSVDDLAAVADALNSRPRKTLGWRTPAEALDELLPLGPTRQRCDHPLNRNPGRVTEQAELEFGEAVPARPRARCGGFGRDLMHAGSSDWDSRAGVEWGWASVS